ncbi:hypothetical protein PHYSODRAFT_346459 [Phytophthora sojae]|uniref:Expansin-like EG45 domain-containing protein n=1 Tax=Phytophthora sojae (strain P6497) TaxID=1094619 RepID=G4ZKU7_PHYSP|nr:hypothetical protein PHYSODRAFT_346459 [Phytophthora sojae]EGZ14543.1 hypothetical protein PHYSODRAFT_346459 [Phytophthora sojae]|eukprot:XP_009528292.1 hypothetical protein PHYSODRAFT_346459 [Phytophthora sojae]
MVFRQVSILAAVLPAMVRAGADTYYTGNGAATPLGQVSGGTCKFMYDANIGENFAALNGAQWGSALSCGRCVEVSCADSRCADKTSTATLHIVDTTPEGKEGDLNLSPAAFKKLTGSDPSQYSIKWKFVDCPATGNIQYCADSLTNSSRLAVQPANFAESVASMKIAGLDAALSDTGAYFFQVKGANADLSAVDVELTSASGKVVKDKVALTAGECKEGTSKVAARMLTEAETFDDLKTGSTNNYKAGRVAAADESSKKGVSILQSNDAAVDKTQMEANTKSEDSGASSTGTSPGIVTLVVLAAVGCVALAVVAVSAKKRKMKEKSIDDLARPFGTFSSPVRINSTIAKI